APVPTPGPAGRHSLALRPLLRRLGTDRKACVLDLGPASGANVAFFSRRPCTLHIADLYRALRSDSGLPRDAAELDSALAPQLPEGPFDLVLAWDLLDYFDRAQLEVLGRHLAERCRPSALVFAIVSYLHQIPDRPHRFEILDEESLVYGDASGLSRPSPGYREPELVRLLPGFAVEASYLLRHGVQEYVLARRPETAPPV
ncbi:MAG: methyltransferase domain-containing protein, partial [Thermoanaerobaculia bacterium]